MFQKNKRVLFFRLIIIFLFVLSYVGYLREGDKRAVFPWEAWLLRDNEDYFIVHNFQDWGDGGYYYWKDGAKIPIYLAGNNPSYELAPSVSGEDANNRFLIKGYIDEEMSETAGKEVLWAEEWDIIAPIRRSYHYDGDNGKMFRPWWYFDRYDVETGLVYDAVKDGRAIARFEAEYIQKNCGQDSCLVTSEYCDGQLQWYIMDEWLVRYSTLTPVTVRGFDFEDMFSERILSDCENRFLLCGKYEEEDGVFIIEEWYFVAPICWKAGYGNAFNCYSEYYFTKEDVEQGIYIPCDGE